MSTESPLTMVSRELSFDDLSAPLSEAAPLGGTGPFVINLGASSAPLELPVEDLASGSQAYVYRIRRNEDGRIRYRLRLGPFVREEDADAALSKVRNVYPSALTATAWVEDLNAIAVQQAKAGITRPVLEGVPKLRAVSAPDTHRATEARSVAEARSVPPVQSLPEVQSLPADECLPEVSSTPQIPTLEQPVAEAAETTPTAEESAPLEADFAGEEIVLAESELHSESIDLDDGEPTIEAPALTELALAAEAAASSPTPAGASPAVRGAADDAPTQLLPAPALEFPELLLLDDVAAPMPQSRPLEGTKASPAATGKVPVLEASFDALSSSLSLEEPLPGEAPVAVTMAPATPVQTPVKQPAKSAAAMPAMPARAVPGAPIQTAATRAAAPAPARGDEPARETPLSLETTQTLRPLTTTEMQNEVALRWFVIQLSLSDQAYDPSAVPNLDIFLLYRLYSVAGVDQGREVHALRLGFFGEEMAAQAVASYLKSYYENPTVKRVSVAERERFSEHRLDARKDVGETGQHAAIELSTERPAAKVETPPPKPAHIPLAQPTAAVRAAALRQISGQQPKKEKPAGVFASLPWIGRRK
jgi:hypothetical protein